MEEPYVPPRARADLDDRVPAPGLGDSSDAGQTAADHLAGGIQAALANARDGAAQQLEQLLRGFNAAYNTRRQRVLDGRTPDQVVVERLKARWKLARANKPESRAGPEDIAAARLIAEDAKEVSQPDA